MVQKIATSSGLEVICHEESNTQNIDIKTSDLDITCGVPQGSILGSLLFIIYINDLFYVSNILQPIVFSDDTNLFSSHSKIKDLFNNVN